MAVQLEKAQGDASDHGIARLEVQLEIRKRRGEGDERLLLGVEPQLAVFHLGGAVDLPAESGSAVEQKAPALGGVLGRELVVLLAGVRGQGREQNEEKGRKAHSS